MKKLSLLLTGVLAAVSSMPAFASQYENAEITPRYGNSGYVYYCVGTGTYSDEYIDTTTEAVTARDYIQKWGYDCDPEFCVYKNPAAKEIQEDRLNSPVVMFSGHGSASNVDCGASGIQTGGRYSPFVDIDNFNLDTVELAFLAACETAPSNGIAARFVKNGALYSIGWEKSPESAHMTTFVKAYFEAIDNDKTFAEAEEQARREVLRTTSGNENEDIYTYKSFGNSNATVYKYARSTEPKKSLHELFIDEDIEHYIVEPGELTYVDGSNDFEAVCEYIKENIEPDFNPDDYRIREIGAGKAGIGYVTMHYLVDGIESDFYYMVTYDKNEVFLIEVLGTDIRDIPIEIDKDSILTEEEILQMAIEELDTTDPINSYHMYIMYDTANRKLRYKMGISLGSDETGYIGRGFTYME
ncbi:MAG: CHAT domain-containing protein [Firmicutes bacterium]|nr:CHAT domain-containing protein [Bacillota bacterium]